MIKRVKQFLIKDIWLEEIEAYSFVKRNAIHSLRVLLMAFKGFREDKVALRSSALTYYSLLSIVPIVAMAFGIAKGFGMDQKLNEILTEKLAEHQDVMNQVIDFANSMLENTKGGLIAGVGVLLLFWSVLKVMANIEESFNAVWGVKKGRSWIRKFTEYLAIMLLAPLLLILSSSLTVYISSKTQEVVNSIDVPNVVQGGVSFFLSLSPYVVFWLLLTMIYMVMPNTKVKFKSALVAGIVAGTIFVFVQWIYVTFQVGVVRFNAIYGSFAALPLFLVWLQMSWLIVLFGAELSFVIQNVEKYLLKEESTKISPLFKKKLSLYVLHYIIKRFLNAEKAPSVEEMQKDLKLPFRLLMDIIQKLLDAHILSEVKTNEYKDFRYQPAVATHLLSIHYVLEALEKTGFDEIAEPDSSVYKEIAKDVDSLFSKKEQFFLEKL